MEGESASTGGCLVNSKSRSSTKNEEEKRGVGVLTTEKVWNSELV